MDVMLGMLAFIPEAIRKHKQVSSRTVRRLDVQIKIVSLA